MANPGAFTSETGAAANQKRFWWWKHRRAVKNGKHRWATMTQEEKDWVNAKRDYANEQRKIKKARLAKKLEHTNFTPNVAGLSDEELDDIDLFFTDVF